MRVTQRDIEVLSDLRFAVDDHKKVSGGEWVRPLDCGGTDGSDHSYRLTKLAKMELAERKKFPGWGGRGSCRYTITEKGRASLRCLQD